jgi:hypothetical protein
MSLPPATLFCHSFCTREILNSPVTLALRPFSLHGGMASTNAADPLLQREGYFVQLARQPGTPNGPQSSLFVRRGAP